MSIPRTVRLEESVEKMAKQYMEINNISFPDLVNAALRKYMTEPQVIELKPIDSKEFMPVAEKAYKKHKHTIDKLK